MGCNTGVRVSFFFLPVFTARGALGRFVVKLLSSLFKGDGSSTGRRRGRSGGGFSVLGCSNVHTHGVNGLPCTVGYFRRTITRRRRGRALNLLTDTCLRTGHARSTHVALSQLVTRSRAGMRTLLSLTDMYCVRRSCRNVRGTDRGTVTLSRGGTRTCCLTTHTTHNLGGSLRTVIVLAGTVMRGRDFARTCLLHTRIL